MRERHLTSSAGAGGRPPPRRRAGGRRTGCSARCAGRPLRTGGGSSGSRSSGGGSSFGGRFHFFRIARRRHDGDQRDVAAGDHAHAFRQRDVAQMLGVIDFELADIDVDGGRDGIGRAAHLDGVGHDVDTAPPRLTPGDCSAFMTWIGI